MNHVNHELKVGFQLLNLFWNLYNILLPPYFVNFYDLRHIKKYWFSVFELYFFCKLGEEGLILALIGQKLPKYTLESGLENNN